MCPPLAKGKLQLDGMHVSAVSVQRRHGALLAAMC